MPDFKKKKEPPKIEDVATEFGKAHAEEADAKKRMEKNRKLFFDLLSPLIREDELAEQTIFYEGEHPSEYVATLYPKWQILKSRALAEGEWQLLLREDPTKKTKTFLNPSDGLVYERQVRESAPQVDLERLKVDDPALYQAITVEPPKPERVLKPLSELTDEEKDELKEYLKPVQLTNAMAKPRKPKPEELDE